MADITILTVGSRGDVQPFCAIALGLMQAGHSVTLASSPNFADFAAQWNIPFAPIAGDFQALLSSSVGLDLLEGNSKAELIEEDLRWQQLLNAWDACQGSDIIVFSPLTTWGYHLAEALKIPGILATQVPVSATRAFPFLGFARRCDQWLQGWANLFSYRLVGFLFWRRSAKVINRFRQDVLGLSKLPWLGAQYRRDAPSQLSPLPVLNCFSSAVIPPALDWDDSVHQGGYCFLDTSKSFTPSVALQDFLIEDPKPLYIGFGSMIPRHPEKLAQMIVSAIEETKQRAVLCSGWGNIKQTDLPSSIFLAESVPHDWLFPRVAAAIHHGGAGTTAATLRAGIPSVVVPFFADQPVWGELLEQIGVSPATYPQMTLTCEQLTDGIRRVVEQDEFGERARWVRSQIMTEDGVTKAVSMIESCLQDFDG
ncbi:MAG: glycosyltransferase [Phormidesmis sp.]